MLNRDALNNIEMQLPRVVLDEIAAQGLDGVRVSRIAERLEISVGLLYKRWGSRDFLLEHTWRACIWSVDKEVSSALVWANEHNHGLAEMYERFVFGLPKKAEAFLELHYSRYRWHRSDVESDGQIVPSLERFVELNLKHGHFRPGPVRTIAGCIWWFIVGSLRCSSDDVWRRKWCIETLKRGLLSRERYLAEDAIDSLEITVEETAEPRGLTPEGAPEPH